MLTLLLVYLLIGACAGLLAGLFGIGGGLLIVPVLVLCFSLMGFPADLVMAMAIATSLATIVVTSISSVRAHQRHGNVRWPVLALLTPGIVVGVWFGVQTATSIPSASLQLVFGCFAILVAAQMWFALKPSAARELPSKPLVTGAGVGIGYLSALFGIGGGTLTVPFLSWNNVRMQQAVGTSAACGLPIALFGALSNIYAGWDLQTLPEHTLGYVYWPAFIGIVSASALCAGYGAKLAQRLPAAKLKKAFAVFLLIIGVQFIVRSL
jgi:uncharacterized membrane protein YfcA